MGLRFSGLKGIRFEMWSIGDKIQKQRRTRVYRLGLEVWGMSFFIATKPLFHDMDTMRNQKHTENRMSLSAGLLTQP